MLHQHLEKNGYSNGRKFNAVVSGIRVRGDARESEVGGNFDVQQGSVDYLTARRIANLELGEITMACNPHPGTINV